MLKASLHTCSKDRPDTICKAGKAFDLRPQYTGPAKCRTVQALDSLPSAPTPSAMVGVRQRRHAKLRSRWRKVQQSRSGGRTQQQPRGSAHGAHPRRCAATKSPHGLDCACQPRRLSRRSDLRSFGQPACVPAADVTTVRHARAHVAMLRPGNIVWAQRF